VSSNQKTFTTTLNEFYADVSTEVEQFQKKRQATDIHEASEFNVFEYFDRDENLLSKIIHDLLDPNGKHGQGMLFLNHFLDAIGVPLKTVSLPVGIKREDCTSHCRNSQRRIDITLDLGDFGVGIENKPFAFESEDQLKDYSEHLSGKYGKRFVLVYLSGDGTEPTSLSKADLAALQVANQITTLAYPTGLHKWLERCARDCKAEKVRWFLQNFDEHVTGKFKLAEADEKGTDEAN
jgi:hypothetical protein